MYVNGGMIPTLILYRNLNLTNSFWVYVIPGMISAFNVLVLRTYMEGLPSALEESAMIDGANDFTIFTPYHLAPVQAGVCHRRPVRSCRTVELLVRCYVVQPDERPVYDPAI